MTGADVLHFGRWAGYRLNLALIVLSGLAEGFGMTMFVPLLEHLDGRAADPSPFFRKVAAAFSAVGLPVTTLTLVAVIIGLALGSLLLGFAQRSHLAWTQFEHLRVLRDDIVWRLFRSDWGHLSGRSHGEMVNVTAQQAARATWAVSYQILLVGALLQVLVYCLLSLALAWQLLLITALFGSLTLLAIRPLLRKTRVLGERETRFSARFDFQLVDFLRSAKLVKATASEAAARDTLATVNGDLCHTIRLTQVVLHATQLLVQAIPVMVLGLVIWVAAEVLKTGTAHLLVFMMLLARTAPKLIQAQQYYQGYVNYRPAIDSVDRVMAEAAAAEEDLRPAGQQFDRLGQAISLDNVGFTYPEAETPALSGLTLTLHRREMVALVGPSGGGKSTIVDLLCGLRWPTEGVIRVDGRDLAELDLISWRRRIGYVAQEVTVLNDTIRNNLLFAHPGADEAAMREALRIAQLSEVVDGLDSGLDTVLGEGGLRFSGGQRQRLALARALLGQPELLLLDEATSALDNESERAIQQAIEDMRHSLTIVVVAHRLSTVRKADMVHVIEAGRLVESGNFEDLIALGGRLTALQAAVNDPTAT